MSESKEQYQREIAELETEIKNMKKKYKKAMKSFKGNTTDEMRLTAENFRKDIKTAEKALREAKVLISIYY